MTIIAFRMSLHYFQKAKNERLLPHISRVRKATVSFTSIAVLITFADAYSLSVGVVGIDIASQLEVNPGKVMQALLWIAFILSLLFTLGISTMTSNTDPARKSGSRFKGASGSTADFEGVRRQPVARVPIRRGGGDDSDSD